MANQDISFCSNRKCENKKCERHYDNIDWSVMPPWRSFVEFEGTKYCPKNKGVRNDERSQGRMERGKR